MGKAPVERRSTSDGGGQAVVADTAPRQRQSGVADTGANVKRTLKVACVVLDGRFGGPQSRIIQVATRLRSRGVETAVLLPAAQSEFFQERLRDAGIPAHMLRMRYLSLKPVKLALNFLELPRVVCRMRKDLRKERADVVHCNGIWQPHGVLAGKLAGAKVLMHLNDTNPARSFKLIFRLLAPLIDGYVVAGQRVNRVYFGTRGRRWFRRPVFEVQDPADVERYDPARVKPDPKVAALLGVKVVTVANINPLKGLEYFVEMARLVSSKAPGVQFFIAGARLGSQQAYADMLERMVHTYALTNVHFLGRVSNVDQVLKASDIYVCTSTQEASPLSVWEAMAMEKAIVSTDVGDVSLFLGDGTCGYVVPVGDVQTLADRVLALVGDAALRERMGKGAREAATQFVSLDRCVERHEEAYRTLVQGKRPLRHA